MLFHFRRDAALQALTDRLEVAFVALNMTAAGRVDRAVRYASGNLDALDRSVGLWEAAATAVATREACVARLERFERGASDPRRFFDAAAGARLKREERQRTKLHEILATATREADGRLAAIEQQLGDIVEVGGRNYR